MQYKVGDIVNEIDVYSGEILDCLTVIETDYGDPSAVDPEDSTSYYILYSVRSEQTYQWVDLDDTESLTYVKV